jgi:hypothetical protein
MPNQRLLLLIGCKNKYKLTTNNKAEIWEKEIEKETLVLFSPSLSSIILPTYWLTVSV